MRATTPSLVTDQPPPQVRVRIEVPRWSFLKRGSNGEIDFVSPLPCPFNYGSVPDYVGLEGDLLDAVVLGPRLPLGSELTVYAYAAIVLTDRGMTDDKLICASQCPGQAELRQVHRFFRFYARCKALLNLYRGRPGRNACDGWDSAAAAIARARPRGPDWHFPSVPF
ncbi:inorganic pyrophosphatase [Alkalispirillum mobile]|uniref:inorganic diphosphatase n=1 Tax=Alkalispirillum mobile TaxID=85925 RepID=A0A498C7C1_9GAMM|nr:inorganic diphosphatase [Alkalispirillum mobile]RLK51652.1 inorganic pyrophosphatase [Alkalispirillum mobile]